MTNQKYLGIPEMECYATHLGLWGESRKLSKIVVPSFPFLLSFSSHLTWLKKQAHSIMYGVVNFNSLKWYLKCLSSLIQVAKRSVEYYNSLKVHWFFIWGVCLRKIPYEKLWEHLGKREKLDLRSTQPVFHFIINSSILVDEVLVM